MTFHRDLDSYLFLETIDSTNLELQRRRHEFSGSNILLVSNEQTVGKGQHGRSWESKAGSGLWASLFLGQEKHLSCDLHLLSLFTGIIIRQSIANIAGIEAELKWPNDIMIQSKKCGGILTEIQWKGSRAKSAVIGFGINLTQEEMDFPSNIRKSATSLLQEGWDLPDRERLVQSFIFNFFEQIELLNDPEHICSIWNQYAWRLNEHIRWEGNGTHFTGTFKGVNSEGEAIVLTDHSVQNVHTGRIHWLEMD
ncbi:MAG: biotin--[acetyl-CoA-carboxylase] ligase [Candidatus Marinimicrobia bacterium]|nr:biotin--[acetyl-CoA-carboxylase] ligase [Candidatus Neomarinimicrobiota bacterium]